MDGQGIPKELLMTLTALRAALHQMADATTRVKGRALFAQRLAELPAESYAGLRMYEHLDGTDCLLSDPEVIVGDNGTHAVVWSRLAKVGGIPENISLDGTGMVELRAAKSIAERAESWLLRAAESRDKEILVRERKDALRAAEIRKMEEQI